MEIYVVGVDVMDNQKFKIDFIVWKSIGYSVAVVVGISLKQTLQYGNSKTSNWTTSLPLSLKQTLQYGNQSECQTINVVNGV